MGDMSTWRYEGGENDGIARYPLRLEHLGLQRTGDGGGRARIKLKSLRIRDGVSRRSAGHRHSHGQDPGLDRRQRSSSPPASAACTMPPLSDGAVEYEIRSFDETDRTGCARVIHRGARRRRRDRAP
jgi:hypothetical protein